MTSIGFSPSRLAAVDRGIRERYIDTRRFVGTQLQVWHRGALVHASIDGFADPDADRPMHDDAIFRIYSMTKPVMAVALLALVEQGRIALFDEVTKYIPSWGGLRVLEGGQLVPPRRPMTILDLARHTSGLSGLGNGEVHRMYQARGIAKFSLEGGLDGLIALLADLPLEFHPGERATYSIGPTVLGYVLQQVCGKPLDQILDELVLAPLGMADTGFVCPPAKAHRLAACYRWNGGNGLVRDTERDFTLAPNLLSGDGGLVSTAADYTRFNRMLLGQGTLDGVRILSPKSFELLRLNHLPGNRDIVEMAGDNRWDGWVADGIGISICCGTTIDVARRMIPSSRGDIFWSGAACTHMLVDPAEDLAWVFMAQLLDSPFLIYSNRWLSTVIYGAMSAAHG